MHTRHSSLRSINKTQISREQDLSLGKMLAVLVQRWIARFIRSIMFVVRSLR
jgi:hypothetical protein